MRSRAIVLAAAFAASVSGGCATPASAPEPPPKAENLVRNPGFEADPAPGRECPPSWWCTMHSNTESFHFSVATDPGSNGRFLKVTRRIVEPWALVTQVIPAAGLAGKRLRVSVSVNTEALDAGAGAGPMIMLQGPGGRVLDHRQVLLARGSGWRRESAEIEVVAGTELVEVALLVEGGGTVGFDDVDVTVLPPARL